ncbi:DNA polymerase III subunit epsilon [Psychrobacter sp. 72-O-c]|uniref:DNA polymerase III subunit epsilon n=1 Tax=Psychrobacter sp. 72-O-c TaxID=2774125 RepID=UPI00191AAE01|nr:DNA polymerase III subunit epsilon [Psychrobacter sp. 72-O-c]
MSDNYTPSQPAIKNHTIDPMAAKTDATVAYTDGACKGNPGAGGWGAHLIFSDGSSQDIYGGDSDTTNNRMELMGAIQALKHSPRELKLEIWTDSSYVKNGITEWIDNWKKKGWKTASRKPVANQDLWQQLDELRQARDVDWHWVKGHAGHAGNEKADELANLGVTSNSEQDVVNKQYNEQSARLIDDTAKKKEQIMPNDSQIHDSRVAPDVDWLLDDPLGLNMMDDGLDLDDDLDDDVNAAESDDGFIKQTTIDQPVTEQTAIEHSSNEHNTTYATDTLTTASTDIDTDISTDAMTTEPMMNSLNTNSNEPAMQDNAPTDLPSFDGDTSRANPHFRPLLPKPINRHEANRQLIMDTETTGLDPLKGDRVIEVGIVEMIGRKFTGEKLHVYINPQRGMDDVVIRIHGISEAFLTDKPTFDKIAKPLYEFMDGAEIIAHNASFDISFLSMEFNKVGLTDFAQRVKVTDSLVMAKQQYPGQKNTLDALVRRLNVGKQDRTFHGALLDSEILAEVYLAMTGGQVTLAIEEDTQTDGAPTAHANFTNLAALLVESTVDEATNQSWFATLAEDYPEIQAKMSQ